jgi:FtsP/CotA-like multicopper oxidase with cupredoxin domain
MALLLVLLVLQPSAAMAAEKIFDLQIEQRKVVRPGASVRVVKGDAVTLRWHSDEAVQLHMHGYDIQLDVAAGTPAEMRFDAKVSGRYPVTSHGFGPKHGNEHGHSHGHEALLYVEVYPE